MSITIILIIFYPTPNTHLCELGAQLVQFVLKRQCLDEVSTPLAGLELEKQKPKTTTSHPPDTHAEYIMAREYRLRRSVIQSEAKRPDRVQQQRASYTARAVRARILTYTDTENNNNINNNFDYYCCYRLLLLLQRLLLLLITTDENNNNIGKTFDYYCCYLLLLLPLLITTDNNTTTTRTTTMSTTMTTTTTTTTHKQRNHPRRNSLEHPWLQSASAGR